MCDGLFLMEIYTLIELFPTASLPWALGEKEKNLLIMKKYRNTEKLITLFTQIVRGPYAISEHII